MIRLIVSLALLGGPLLHSQTRLSLPEAAAREAGSEALKYAGQTVALRGKVAAGPIPVTDYAHLAIQDDSGCGFVIEAPFEKLKGFQAGDVIEAVGRIAHRAGLPVLRPERIDSISREPAPAPQRARIAELNSPGMLGRWVETEGVVTLVGSNRGGETLRISDGREEITGFLPFLARSQGSLSGYRPGDRVRVRAIASQYSPLPPHRGSYQLMIGDAEWVRLIHRRPILPIWSAGLGLGAVILVLLLWYARERRMSKYPHRMRRLYSLGEALLGCRGLEQSLNLLEENLPALLGVTSVRLYLHDPVTSSLRRMGCSTAEPPVSLNHPQGFRDRAVALSFYNRAPIVIPDSQRSALFEGVERGPRSLLAVPMLAQGQPLGVLELANDVRPCSFSDDEVAVVQHLANQIAIGMRLLERETVREQAAGSQQYQALVHVVAGALREIDRWLGAGDREPAQAAAPEAGPTQPGIRPPPAVEAALARLRRFCAPAEAGAPVDFTALVRNLLSRFTAGWREASLEVEEHLTQEPLVVAGIHSATLEELIAALFAGAGRVASASGGRCVCVRLVRLAGSVLLEAGVNHPQSLVDFDPFADKREDASGVLPLSIARALARNRGGDLRWEARSPTGPRLELELPLGPGAQGRAATGAASGVRRVLTALLLDPVESSRQALLAVLGNAGHRCVATADADQAVEMLRRNSFDVFFCARQIASRPWEQLFDVCRQAGIPFVLLIGEGEDAERIPFADGAGFALPWPGSKRVVLQVLDQVQARLEASGRYNGE